MTELIGTHQIPCIGDTDYAAWALYMQCVANQVESQLAANAAAVAESRNRPVRAWSRSEVQTPGGGSVASSGTVLYSYNFNASPTFGTALATLNVPGWWNIGFNARVTSSAPVVPNWRVGTLAVFTPGTPPALQTLTSGEATITMEDVVWESNTTGGEVLYAAADVYNPGNPNAAADTPGLTFRYGIQTEFNGVENVTFDTTIWAVFLGDTPTISVA